MDDPRVQSSCLALLGFYLYATVLATIGVFVLLTGGPFGALVILGVLLLLGAAAAWR